MTRQVFTDVEEAIAFLDRPEKRAEWTRYQVDYPDAKQGPYEIEGFEIPQDSKWRRTNITLEGMDRDTGYGEFHKLLETKTDGKRLLWMSDTRAEIMEHSPILNKLELCGQFGQAKRILINGLGLGVIAKAALNTPGVEHVDVVDINADVIELVGGFLTEDPRITIHLADAYEITWPRGTHWDLAWHDIWPGISDDNLPDMYRLRKKYKNLVEWQDCWQIQGCRAMADVLVRMERKTLPVEEAILILAGFSSEQAKRTKIDWSK
jgi:hypothetical protein